MNITDSDLHEILFHASVLEQQARDLEKRVKSAGRFVLEQHELERRLRSFHATGRLLARAVKEAGWPPKAPTPTTPVGLDDEFPFD